MFVLHEQVPSLTRNIPFFDLFLNRESIETVVLMSNNKLYNGERMMKIEEFISTMTEWCEKTNNTYDFTIGKDMSVNTRITIDEEGFIWIRACESFKRVKTTVNVCDINEFRLSDFDEECFYVICNDDTGFEVHESEFYYCIDGQPSGWGSAVEHFTEFPRGEGYREEKERLDKLVSDWGKEHKTSDNS